MKLNMTNYWPRLWVEEMINGWWFSMPITTSFAVALIGLTFYWPVFAKPSVGQAMQSTDQKNRITTDMQEHHGPYVTEMLNEARAADSANPGLLDRKRKELESFVENHLKSIAGWWNRSKPPEPRFATLNMSLPELTYFLMDTALSPSVHIYDRDLLGTILTHADSRRFPLLLELIDSGQMSEYFEIMARGIAGRFPLEIAVQWLRDELKANRGVGPDEKEELFLGFCEKWAKNLPSDLREYCFDRVWSQTIQYSYHITENWKVLDELNTKRAAVARGRERLIKIHRHFDDLSEILEETNGTISIQDAIKKGCQIASNFSFKLIESGRHKIVLPVTRKVEKSAIYHFVLYETLPPFVQPPPVLSVDSGRLELLLSGKANFSQTEKKWFARYLKVYRYAS